MANVKMIFNGSEISETEEHELVAYANTKGEIYISIDSTNDIYFSFICLDKETAVRLVRELKKQIGYL